MVAALVAAALLGIAAMLVIQAFKTMSQGRMGLNRRLQGDEAMVTASVGVQQADFGDVLGKCRTRAVLNIPSCSDPTKTTPDGPCVVSGKLNAALGNPPPDTLPWATEVLRDAYGRPSPQGTQCSEVIRCCHRASGRILEVMVQGNWLDDSSEGVMRRRLTFRRTRW